MMRGAASAALRACVALAFGVLNATASGDDALRASLDRALNGRHDLATAAVGVHVLDAASGRTLYSRGGERSLIPASNMKLLSTGAALLVMGPEGGFRTEVRASQDGPVVVVGSGDPGLGDPALLEAGSPSMSAEQLLERLAAAVAKTGVTRVREVVVDDRVFERTAVHPTWPAEQLNRWYCAEVSGVNFHTNVFTVFIDPGRTAGATPSWTMQPAAPWVEVANRAKTVASGPHTVWLARPAPENRYTMYGDVRLGGSAAVDVTLHDPALTMGQLLAAALAAKGVAVGGEAADMSTAVRATRLVEAEERFDGVPAAAVVHTSLIDALRRANNDSQNLYSEALLKAAGHAVTGEPGSWDNGAAVVRMLLSQRVGPEAAAGTVVADGSGMSRENRVAPATITAWLGAMYRDETVRQAYVASLARPGTGTLRNRFEKPPLSSSLHAKSGYLNGVRALSGYVVGEGGQAVVFSVLCNNLNTGKADAAARDLHEDVVMALDRWLQTRSVTVERPASAPAEAFGG